MSNIPISVNMTVAESAAAYNMTVQDQIVVNPAPSPTNMIANGDFSVAGATTDGWTTTYPARCAVSVSNSNLVLSVTNKSNINYGMIYSVNIEQGHVYLIKYKYKKTLGDGDNDGKTVRVMFGNVVSGTDNQDVSRMYNLTQGDVVENVGCQKALSNYDNISICFASAIAQTACENGDHVLELSYIKMYDITDIVSGL